MLGLVYSFCLILFLSFKSFLGRIGIFCVNNWLINFEKFFFLGLLNCLIFFNGEFALNIRSFGFKGNNLNLLHFKFYHLFFLLFYVLNQLLLILNSLFVHEDLD